MIEIPKKIDLVNPEFLQAWNLITHTHQSVFLTGKAGTGKSTFLRYICEHTKKKYVVLAPTGVAAMNVGGVTLHSFFQIPTRPIPPDDSEYSISKIRKKLKFNKEKIKLIRSVELIIIDEISMVRSDIIDFVDRVLRSYSDNKKEPFGGKQMLFVGDIFQLEPVITADTRDILSRYYKNFFFFNAKVYDFIDLISIELKKIYRQNDTSFVKILDKIRINNVSSEDLQIINSRYCNQEISNEKEFTITLASRRDIVDNINSKNMDILPGEEYIFKGEIHGDFPEKLLPTDRDLVLKNNAQIILIKNDKDKRWANGTIAKVYKITSDNIMIKLENGNVHTLSPEIWRNIKYTYNEDKNIIEEEVLGEFIQFPIKAAWALTIHKSQGLTFNNVILDLGDGAFSCGQTYVALSRCTSLEGIILKSLLTKRDIIVNPSVVDFSKSFNDQKSILNAISYAKADILYREAITHFNNYEFTNSVDKLSEAISLRNDLSDKKVRRLIGLKLSTIRQQAEIINQMKAQLKELAAEYVDMGGECLQYDDTWEAALANFKKALKLDPNNENALYGQALSLKIGGQFEESISVISVIRQLNPKHFNAICLLGTIYSDKGVHDKALLTYMTALKLKKKDSDLHFKIAVEYDAIGLDDEAEHYRQLGEKYKKRER